MIIVPSDVYEELNQLLEEYYCEGNLISLKETGYSKVNIKGNGHNIVSVVTELFTRGRINVLVGTKEELFDKLAGEQARVIQARYMQAHADFARLSPEQQRADMSSISYECMDWMVDYVYDNLDAFKLLICCSEGTKYENLIHEMVEIEVESTRCFIQNLRNLGQEVPEVDPQLEHILASGMLTAFFEMVVHDMTKSQAVNYVRELREFYTAGWGKIMGL